MPLTYIEKDILTVEEGYIFQQVNNKGVMGAGLALQTKRKFPYVYEFYKKQNPKLNEVLFAWKGGTRYFVLLCAQDGYGREKGKCYTNYMALSESLREANSCIQEDKSLHREEKPYYFPYLMGCGLAGGDWKIVEPLIEKYFPNAIICKLPKEDS